MGTKKEDLCDMRDPESDKSERKGFVFKSRAYFGFCVGGGEACWHLGLWV
jgi:hypothetical protein